MTDNREVRQQLIKQIEEIRGSRVLTYITGDRPGVPGHIGEDAVRRVVEHLRQFGPIEKLDLFLYSRGGGMDVPWHLVSAFRSVSEKWSVLVPFRAHSAATMIALGADEVVMGPHACLGPIDPALISASQEYSVSVEDVMAYIDFMRERVGLSDQVALTNGLSNLMNRVDAVTLGSVYRTHSHIRDVAQKIINSRKEPPKNEVQETIIGALAEKVYAHGHAISGAEAKSIGLPVQVPPHDLEEKMWELLSTYESHMMILQPWNSQDILDGMDSTEDECVVAMIESTAATHELRRTIEVIQQRMVLPQNLHVNFNLSVQSSVEEEFGEEWIEQLQARLQEEARLAVQQALEAQAPRAGIKVTSRDSGWHQTGS